MEKRVLQKLVAASAAIYDAKCRDTLFRAMHDGCSSLGLEGFNLSCSPRNKSDVIVNATLTTHSDDYRRDYDRLGWSDGDIYISRAFDTDRTFRFSSEMEHPAGIQQRGFIDFLRGAGIKFGVVTPLRRGARLAGVLAMGSRHHFPESAEIVHAGTMMAEFAMAQAERLGLASAISSDEAIARSKLSELQNDVLGWVAEGKSNLDIATIMGMSDRAVRHHVSEILRKLGLVSRNQAATLFRSGKTLR